MTKTEIAATSTGQVSETAAEIYERFFVPAALGQWAARVADAAGVGPGQRVLDVACGTGVLTRAVAARTGVEARVTGLDINPGMLAVARRLAPRIDWRQGPAESLPFGDGEFDAVVSQFGLMFFRDRVGALREMRRVLRPGGALAVAVWGPLARSPGYAALSALLREIIGEAAAAENDAPFALGDAAALAGLFADAGIEHAQVRTLEGIARFPSLEAWMNTEVKGWTLGDQVDDAGYARLLEAARTRLRAYEQADGSVAFPLAANLATARR